MTAEPRLTLQDLIRDKVLSVTLLLGVLLSEHLKSRLASPAGSAIALLELALICVAAVYLLRATNVLAAQLAVLVEHHAISGSRSRATARLASGSACLLVFLRAVLRVVLAVLVLAIPVLALFTVLAFLGSPLTDGSWKPQGWPILLPVQSVITITAVAGLVVGTWLVRGISYLLQARCQAILSVSHPLAGC